MGVREDWSSEQLLAARKVYRRNGNILEALEAMGSRMTPKSAINKLRQYGMIFNAAPRMWDGTSAQARKLKETYR